MNRLKRVISLSFLFCLFTLVGFAQTPAAPPAVGRVSGTVVDAQGKPVSYATVTLLRKDSSVVSGDLSKDDGTFSIGPTGVGSFILRVNAIGLLQKTVPVEITADNPNKKVNVKVSAAATALKSVEVVGERPLMEMSVDKKVFNVEKNITTAGGSATDVLSNVPAVTVDADGNVSLRGKTDVTVLIDGKPATLLGSDVTSALQSLPGSSIESVEVITNPSAKYDAQGLTGIINIVTKKDKRLGINGNLSLGAGTRDKYNGNLGLNVRKGKWNVFLNSSFRLNHNYNNTTTDQENNILVPGTNSFHTYEHAQRHFNGFFNTIGATYDFDKYNSLTFTQNVNSMNFGYLDYSDYTTYASADQTGERSSLMHRTSDANGGPLSFSSALDYKHKFKKKKDEELDIDATYSISDFSRVQHYHTDVYDSSNTSLYGTIYETAPATGTNSTFNAWADYTDPLFTKNGKLGLGWKSQFYDFTSSNNPFVDTPGRAEAVDSSILTRFNYTQQIHAGYINWNDQMGKFTYQAGLRAEDVIYNGSNDVIATAKYQKSYFNFFPSAFISYQLPKQQTVNLNYSRRTNRPNFWQLLPYKDVSNPGIVSEGNPNLDPEFIHNIELSYSKQTTRGDNFIANIYYQYTQNLIERITRTILQSDSGLGSYIGRQFTQPMNLASGVTYGFEGTGHMQILPIWDLTMDVNLFQNEIKIGNVDPVDRPYVADNSGFSWFGKLTTNIKLPKNLSLQIMGNYESARPIAQGHINEIYWIDAALRWNFLKNNRATLVLNVSDIFNTHKATTIYDLMAYDETYYRDHETRIGNLTFTYRFGKSDFGSKAGRGKGKQNNQPAAKPGEEDRENNLKQDDNDQGGGGQGGGAKGGMRS